MRLFDTHAHISLIDDDPIEQLIAIREAKKSNVHAIVTICSNIDTFEKTFEDLQSEKSVFYSVGISPSAVEELPPNWQERLAHIANRKGVVAIGETGLDYYRKYGNKREQIELFMQQLDIARELDLPVVLHNREAGEDILKILLERIPPRGVVFHCYSENWEFAKKTLDLNVMYSFAGSVTYRNARHLHETATNLPIERILIESETPFIPPSKRHGKRNRPAYLIDTAESIAKLRNEDLEEFTEQVFLNSEKFFDVSV